MRIIISLTALLLAASLWNCQPATITAQAMPTMSATWYWPTPTVVIVEPVIFTEFVFLPEVRR